MPADTTLCNLTVDCVWNCIALALRKERRCRNGENNARFWHLRRWTSVIYKIDWCGRPRFLMMSDRRSVAVRTLLSVLFSPKPSVLQGGGEGSEEGQFPATLLRLPWPLLGTSTYRGDELHHRPVPPLGNVQGRRDELGFCCRVQSCIRFTFVR